MHILSKDIFIIFRDQKIGSRKKTDSESSSDTVILDSSHESDHEREKVIIEESLNEIQGDKSKKAQGNEDKQKVQ